MYSPQALAQIEAELKTAERARENQNEGQARVCARRACGIAIREFLLQNHQTVPPASAVDLIELLCSQPGYPDEIRRVAEHLLMRVTPDHDLPIQIDLLAETRWLIQSLQSTNYPAN